MLVLFHRTTADAAREILTGGFRDSTNKYLTDENYTGIWLSDKPLDINDGAIGDVLLQITFSFLTEHDLANFEWFEEGRSHREWLLPAHLVNENATIGLAKEEA